MTMMKYSKLNNYHKRKRFDPSNDSDLQEFKYFLDKNNWRTTCPFYLEDPWEDIPAMCKDKFVNYAIKQLKVKSPK